MKKANVNVKRSFLRKKKIIALSSLTAICILAFTVFFPFLDKTDNSEGADNIVTLQSEDARPLGKEDGLRIDIPGCDGTKKGSEGNPFVVVELVPFLEMQQVGYFVEGSQPIEIEALCDKTWYSNAPLAGEGSSIYGKSDYYIWHDYKSEQAYKIKDVPSKNSEEFKKQYEELFPGHTPSYANANDLQGWVELSSKEVTDTQGYFKRVASGTGDYELSIETWHLVISFKAKTGGDYVWVHSEETPEDAIDLTSAINNFGTPGSSPDWNKKVDGMGVGEYFDKIGRCTVGTTLILPGSGCTTKLYTYGRGRYESTELFKKEIFFYDEELKKLKENADEDSKDFYMKVIAITPQDLLQAEKVDTEETLDFMERADLLYVNNTTQQLEVVSLFNKYSKQVNGIKSSRYEDIKTEVSTANTTQFSYTYDESGKPVSNDIPWSAAMKLLNRVGENANLPIWYCSTVIQDNTLAEGEVKSNVHFPNWVQSYPVYTPTQKEIDAGKNDNVSGSWSYLECQNGLRGTTNNIAKMFYLLGQVTPEHMYQDIYPDLMEVTITEQITSRVSVTKSTGYYNFDFFKQTSGSEVLEQFGPYKYSPCKDMAQHEYVTPSTTTVLADYEPANIYWTPRTFWPTNYPDRYIGYGSAEFYQFMSEQGMNLYNDQQGSSSEFHSGYAGWGLHNLFSFDGDSWLGSSRPEFSLITYYIRSILNLTGMSHPKVSLSQVRILDLEPCNDFTLTKEDFSDLMNNYSEKKIVIDRMTTAEFNASQKSVYEYDLIYVGTNTGILNLQGQDTMYNDSNMNGYIYTHVGDQMQVNTTSTADWLSTGDVRLPGNDISSRRKEELNKYINSGSTLIFDPRFYADEEVTKTKLKNPDDPMNSPDLLDEDGKPITYQEMVVNGSLTKLNRTAIDSNSNIAKFFVETVGASKSNVFKHNTINEPSAKYVEVSLKDAKGNTYIDTQKQVDFYTRNDFVANINQSGIHMSTVVVPDDYQGVDNTNFVSVSDEENPDVALSYTFKVKGDSEKTFECQIYIDYNYNGIFEDFEVVTEKSFNGNTETTITTSFKKNLVAGSFAWKAVVLDKNDTNKKFVKTGTCAIEYKPENRKVMRVLQVTDDDTSVLNMSTNTQFEDLMKDLNDYQFIFTTISASELEELYDGVPRTKQQWNKDVEATVNGSATTCEFRDTIEQAFSKEKEETDRFKDIDILLIGFGEKQQISSNRQFYENVDYFMSEGKPVIFTNDTTSMNNGSISETVAADQGAFANTHFRAYLGLDRFGVKNEQSYKPKSGTPTYDSALALAKAGEEPDSMYSELHGYNYYSACRIGSGGNTYLPNTLMNGITDTQGNNKTVTVDLVNAGTVSKYPYKIADTITVSPSHGQDYQLNPEDKEVVSYFALGGVKNSDGTYSDDGIYSSSPRDGFNNYYLYQKNNAIYSGIGSNENITDEEAKLFVNTLVMAANMYSASGLAPKITIKDAIDINDDLTCVYVDMDDDYQYIKYRDSDVMDITFKAEDLLLNGNILMTAALLNKEDTSDTVIEEGVSPDTSETLNDEFHDYQIYDSDGQALERQITGAYLLKSDEWYTIRYQLKDYKSTNKRIIKLTAKCVFNGKIKTKKQEVTLKRRTLFNLD